MKRSEKLQLIHAIVMQSGQFDNWYSAAIAENLLIHTGWRIGEAKRLASNPKANLHLR